MGFWKSMVSSLFGARCEYCWRRATCVSEGGGLRIESCMKHSLPAYHKVLKHLEAREEVFALVQELRRVRDGQGNEWIGTG